MLLRYCISGPVKLVVGLGTAINHKVVPTLTTLEDSIPLTPLSNPEKARFASKEIPLIQTPFEMLQMPLQKLSLFLDSLIVTTGREEGKTAQNP